LAKNRLDGNENFVIYTVIDGYALYYLDLLIEQKKSSGGKLGFSGVIGHVGMLALGLLHCIYFFTVPELFMIISFFFQTIFQIAEMAL
jgi:hypothetical protein